MKGLETVTKTIQQSSAFLCMSAPNKNPTTCIQKIYKSTFRINQLELYRPNLYSSRI